MSYAPIVLFVYNRPDHTRQTLEALKANYLAPESELFIYADAARDGASPEVQTAVAEVRALIHGDQWCGRVHIVEQAANKGLYRSVRDGVTEVVEQYGRVIVMEDDLVTSPAFLDYMNRSLDRYESYPAVFSIGGYSYPEAIMPIPEDYPYDNYTCLRNCSWGWATWKDRWSKVDWEVTNYDALRTNPAAIRALNRMGDDEYEMLVGRMSGRLNIWSIQFTMAHYVNHAVAMCPCVSYVNNVGLDGSGENCGANHKLHHLSLSSNREPRLTPIVYEDDRIINAFYNVNCRRRRSLWQRVVNGLCRLVGCSSPYAQKGRVYA